MPGVLGVDSSTQSTKVELRDADDGTLLGSGRAPHPPTHPPRSEQDPLAWADALAAALHDGGIRWRDVDAVSVAGQQHGLVALDAAGEVIRPAKLWNDTESAPDAEWLLRQLDGGAAEWAQRCGSVPVAAFTITKLSWLHRCEPDAWARRVCLPHDWLTYHLTGEFVTDRGDASGTGYWSPAHDAWALDLLAQVDGDRDWEPMLPRIAGPHATVGSVLGSDTIVAAGTGDNMAAALGIGLQFGDIAVSIGTSGTVYTRHAEPTADASGAVAGFADATGEFLPLVCTLNASKVTDAIARAFLGVDHERLDALALAHDPDPERDPILVPYFDGERTPNRPDARGTLSGITSDVTREQLADAAFTGVVCGLLDGLDALVAATGVRPHRLVAIGGGARSAAYRRRLADIAQLPVVVPAAGELVARGACVQAAAALHAVAPDAITNQWAAACERAAETAPDPARAARGTGIRERYAAERG